MSESNYHITKFLTESVLVIEIRKTQIFTNKPVCLGLSILELSKIVMYEIWYDYIKPKYEDKAKLCFFVDIKTDDIFKDIARDVEKQFDTSNYELDRPLLKGKNKKVISLMKDELGGKIMKYIWIESKKS